MINADPSNPLKFEEDRAGLLDKVFAFCFRVVASGLPRSRWSAWSWEISLD